jgi:hypothetical protein
MCEGVPRGTEEAHQFMKKIGIAPIFSVSSTRIPG